MDDDQGHMDDALDGAKRAVSMLAALPADNRMRLFVESRLAGLECDAGHAELCREQNQRVYDAQRKAFGEDDADSWRP